MHLKKIVSERLTARGRTHAGCEQVLHHLLDEGQDVCEFMQLFNEANINAFYLTYDDEIDALCGEDEFPEQMGAREWVTSALQKILMLIEEEMKDVHHSPN